MVKPPAAPEAFALLRDDHARVRDLFEAYLRATTPQKDTLFEKIKHELDAHAVVLEEVFDTRVEPSLGPEPMEAAREGRRAIRDHLRAIAHAQPQDPEYDRLVERLRAAFEEHVALEEGQILLRAASAMGPEEQRELEDEMSARKRGVLEEMAYP